MSEWTDHVARWKDCTDCPLCQQRDQIVLARGQVPADVVFIGEAPGASEDALGMPFVGPAGHLLDGIISNAIPQPAPGMFAGMGLAEDTPWDVAHDRAVELGLISEYTVWLRYALTNLVACYPREAKGRGDNEPESEEIEACRGRLVEFVRLCRPRLIVLVGQLARRWVYGASMFRLDATAMQPEWLPRWGILEFVEIVHPAAILRMPLIQRQMAAQKAAVQIRSGIDRILQTPRRIDPEVERARIEERPDPAAISDADIPF